MCVWALVGKSSKREGRAGAKAQEGELAALRTNPAPQNSPLHPNQQGHLQLTGNAYCYQHARGNFISSA